MTIDQITTVIGGILLLGLSFYGLAFGIAQIIQSRTYKGIGTEKVLITYYGPGWYELDDHEYNQPWYWKTRYQESMDVLEKKHRIKALRRSGYFSIFLSLGLQVLITSMVFYEKNISDLYLVPVVLTFILAAFKPAKYIRTTLIRMPTNEEYQEKLNELLKYECFRRLFEDTRYKIYFYEEAWVHEDLKKLDFKKLHENESYRNKIYEKYLSNFQSSYLCTPDDEKAKATNFLGY